jgi:hypothetical protein
LDSMVGALLGQRRGCRVLPRHQPAIGDGEGLEVSHAFVTAAQLAKAGFEQEGHGLVHSGGAFLAIGEPGDAAAAHQRSAGFVLDVHQSGRAVADGGDDLALRPCLAHQRGQFRAFGQIPHGAVPARQKHCIVFRDVDGGERKGLGQRAGRGHIAKEAIHAVFVLTFWLDRARVDGRGAALDGGERHRSAGVEKRIPGRRQFLEPEAGRLVADAHGASGGEDEEDFDLGDKFGHRTAPLRVCGSLPDPKT